MTLYSYSMGDDMGAVDEGLFLGESATDIAQALRDKHIDELGGELTEFDVDVWEFPLPQAAGFVPRGPGWRFSVSLDPNDTTAIVGEVVQVPEA